DETIDSFDDDHVKVNDPFSILQQTSFPIDDQEKEPPRVLTIAQIYHLKISEEKVRISVLIEAVNLLPELNTLKLHSLSLYEPRMLNSEELQQKIQV
ncbi:unnamed protein product, partial [Didymodactylos carnosus]